MKRIIETDRLFLRELALSDKNELAKIFGDPESMIFLKYFDKKIMGEIVQEVLYCKHR